MRIRKKELDSKNKNEKKESNESNEKKKRKITLLIYIT